MDAANGTGEILDALSGFVDVAVELLAELAAGRLGSAQQEVLGHAVPHMEALRTTLELLLHGGAPSAAPRGIQGGVAADANGERRRRRRDAPPPARGLRPIGPAGEPIAEDDDGEAALSAWLSGLVPPEAGPEAEQAIDGLARSGAASVHDGADRRADDAADAEGDNDDYFVSMSLERVCRPFREMRALADELPGSVTMQGTTASLPLAALLNFIVMNRSSGALRARGRSESMDLFFDNGTLVQVLSDNKDEPMIGEILVANRVIDARTLEGVVSGIEPGTLQLGSVLRGLDLVTAEQLCDALEIQARTRFFRLFGIGELAFSFHEGAYPPSDERLRLDVQGLLIEAAAMSDDSSEIARAMR